MLQDQRRSEPLWNWAVITIWLAFSKVRICMAKRLNPLISWTRRPVGEILAGLDSCASRRQDPGYLWGSLEPTSNELSMNRAQIRSTTSRVVAISWSQYLMSLVSNYWKREHMAHSVKSVMVTTIWCNPQYKHTCRSTVLKVGDAQNRSHR